MRRNEKNNIALINCFLKLFTPTFCRHQSTFINPTLDIVVIKNLYNLRYCIPLYYFSIGISIVTACMAYKYFISHKIKNVVLLLYKDYIFLISNPNFFTNFSVCIAISRSYNFSLSGRLQ